jgi:hypothetical protein
VAAYAELAGLERRFDGFQVVEASTDGSTVTVRLAGQVGLLVAGRRGGYPIEVTARARAPIQPSS